MTIPPPLRKAPLSGGWLARLQATSGQIALLVAAVLLFGGGAAAPARAAGFPSAFVVADVPLDAAGPSGVAARESARSKGAADALTRLLQRLTRREDWPGLPPVSAKQASALVQDFRVQSERSAPDRYIATYTYRFNPNGVRRLLRGSGIAFTELASKPVVIVPLYRKGALVRLWDDPNPWREAWRAANGQAGLVPFVLPVGDLEDVQALDAPAAAKPEPDRLARLAQRYDGGDVVIAEAHESESGAPALDITVTRFVPDGPHAATAQASGDRADKALHAQGVRAAVEQLESLWKEASPMPPTAAAAGSDQTLDASVPIAGAADWARIRRRLAQTSGVQGMDVILLARDAVRVHLRIQGDPAALKLALAQQDLDLATGGPQPVISWRAGMAPPAAGGR